VERRDLVWLGAITLAGAVARFATLDLQGFHHDEAVTAGRVLQPGLGDTLGWVVDSERSPPLYYLLAWPWAKLFGTGEVGLRSLSALIGTAAIPAAWFAARELATRRAGLVVAALVAFSPMLIWYSQEARSYGLFALFSTVALGFFARAARDPAPRALWSWAAASALALLSHYFALFLIGPQALWLLHRAGPGRRIAAMAAAAVVLVGLALVPLAIAQQGEGRSDSFADRALEVRALEVAVDAFAGEEPNPFVGEREVDAVQGGALAAGILALVGAVALVARAGTPREREGAALAGGVAAAAIGIPLVLALVGLDFANPRNMIGATVPLLCVIGIGFAVERHRRLGLAAAVALCVAFAVTVAAAWSLEKMQRDDWRSVAEAIGPAAGRRILVINHNGDNPVEYYLGARPLDSKRYEDGIRVREIVAASNYPAINPPPGWDLTFEDRISTFYVREFTRSPAELVRPADPAVTDLLTEKYEAFVDRPGGGP
jgi:mannosyltransferase